MLLIRIRSRIYTDTVSSLSACSLASACLLCYNGKGLFSYMRPFTVNMLQRPCSSLIGWQLGNIHSCLYSHFQRYAFYFVLIPITWLNSTNQQQIIKWMLNSLEDNSLSVFATNTQWKTSFRMFFFLHMNILSSVNAAIATIHPVFNALSLILFKKFMHYTTSRRRST